MNDRYGRNDFLIYPQDLQDFAWSAPMRDLAATIGLSDVGLKKILKSHSVVTPPQGYWNRVRAGKPVPECPTVPARRPGETGRVRLDSRFANAFTPAEPLPSSGPFASAAVPEDLDELYAQELKAVGRVGIPRTLARIHSAIRHILQQEQRRRSKVASDPLHWDAPRLDSPADQRRLRIFNGLFLALSRRDHSADAYERDGDIHATAMIGDTRVGFSIDFAGKHRTVRMHGRLRNAADLSAKTPLMLTLDPTFDHTDVQSWHDDSGGTLEEKLSHITASIVVAGEATFRRSLKEAEEREKEFRRFKEQRRREEIEARNRERLNRLRESGKLLRQAEDIRRLIVRVRSAVKEGPVEIDETELDRWEKWASDEADRLDPVKSGQIMTHLSDESGGS